MTQIAEFFGSQSGSKAPSTVDDDYGKGDYSASELERESDAFSDYYDQESQSSAKADNTERSDPKPDNSRTEANVGQADNSDREITTDSEIIQLIPQPEEVAPPAIPANQINTSTEPPIFNAPQQEIGASDLVLNDEAPRLEVLPERLQNLQNTPVTSGQPATAPVAPTPVLNIAGVPANIVQPITHEGSQIDVTDIDLSELEEFDFDVNDLLPQRERIPLLNGGISSSFLNFALPMGVPSGNGVPGQAAPVVTPIIPDTASMTFATQMAAQGQSPVVQQVATAIANIYGAGERMEIQLDPPDLGRVFIDFNFDGDRIVNAVVSAEQSETTNLMRKHSDILARELASSGFENVSLSFGENNQQSREQNQQETSARQANVTMTDPLAPPMLELASVVARTVASSGRIDLRL